QSAKEKVQDFELSEAESSFMQLLDEGVKTSEVYKGLGDVYFKLEEYKKALDYYNEIFELSDGDEALTIDSEISRINVLIKLARFNDAQQKIIQVEKLVEDKSVYLKQYINILDIKGNLMLIQGILDIAEEYFNKSLETKLKHYGDLNLKVADSYNNLGIIYRKKNKLKLAEEYILKALDIKKEFLGENHPEIAEVYNSLALVYWTANDLEKAEDFLTISIEIKKMIFGEGQVSLAKGYINLGALYWKKQNYIEAEEFYKNALCILKNAFGEEHSNVAVCYYNLGLLYFITDDLNDAELNTKKALALCLLIYGEVHPETAKANNTLGLIYLSRNELNEAEILEKKALDIYENIYGHDDAFLIDAIINIAETLSKKSEFDQAKEYLDRAAKLIEKLNEEDFPIYYFRLNYLLGLYYKAKGEEDLLSTTISNAKRVVEKIKSVPLYPMLKKQVEEFLEEHV
ncbi:tetratricopeptide repeat protein, partial [Candidatus Dependentiae bacterium]|nr:tetratricopeptide repeat protein [Candidatus Dependentiae bacterium]